MLAIIKKELKTYFLTPIGYICIAIIIAMSSLFFLTDIIQYTSLKFEYMFSSLVTIITFIIPILTMRTFTEERKNKTEQLLITSTKNTLSIVLGKFFAITIMIIITQIIMSIYYAILVSLGNPQMQTAILASIGFLLISMSYISIGIMISSLTENQITAGITTMIILVGNWFIPDTIPALSNYSLIHMFDKTFYLGILSAQSIILYITTTITCIIITTQLLQLRRKNKKIKMIAITTIAIITSIIINVIVAKAQIPEIDLTQEKFYSLTEQTKQTIQNIKEPVNIYIFGYNDSDSVTILANKYHQYNTNITVKTIDIEKDSEIAEKYSITTSDEMGVVIGNENNQKILASTDLYTYNQETKTSTDLTEEKITNAIIDVTNPEKQNIYFLSGHGEYTPSNNMEILSTLIYNEAYEIYQLEISSEGEIPENCNLLIIAAPTEDIKEKEKNAILKYIQNGGKILWLNNVQIEEKEMPNIQEILDQYGIKFESGIILETDLDKTILNNQEYLIPQLSTHKINENIYNANGVMLIDPGKIEVANDEELENKNITYKNILKTTQTSFLRKDLTQTQAKKQESDEQGGFIIAGEFTKQLENQKSTNMIAISNAVFASDSEVEVGDNSYSTIYIMNNKKFILNTIQYLTNRTETVKIEKQESEIAYTENKTQDIVIKTIITTMPIIILAIGTIVNAKRNKRK